MRSDLSITYRNGVTPSNQSIKTDMYLKLRSGMYTTGGNDQTEQH
jgi:hypothetical protein